MLRLAVLRVAGASSADWQFAMPTGKAIVFEVEGDEITLISDVDRSKADPLKAARVQIALTERAV
jgi:hypothetical protein